MTTRPACNTCVVYASVIKRVRYGVVTSTSLRHLGKDMEVFAYCYGVLRTHLR